MEAGRGTHYPELCKPGHGRGHQRRLRPVGRDKPAHTGRCTPQCYRPHLGQAGQHKRLYGQAASADVSADRDTEHHVYGKAGLPRHTAAGGPAGVCSAGCRLAAVLRGYRRRGEKSTRRQERNTAGAGSALPGGVPAVYRGDRVCRLGLSVPCRAHRAGGRRIAERPVPGAHDDRDAERLRLCQLPVLLRYIPVPARAAV